MASGDVALEVTGVYLTSFSETKNTDGTDHYQTLKGTGPATGSIGQSVQITVSHAVGGSFSIPALFPNTFPQGKHYKIKFIEE